MTKTNPPCDICRGNKRIRLPVVRDLSVEDIIDGTGMPDVAEDGWREFDCPQCSKMVSTRRVRALRVVSKVDFEQFGKYQNPIERGLAQQFGAYLHREGLIKFGADNLDDFTKTQVQVTATINVVLPRDAAGQEIEVLALNGEPPPIPKRITREERERLAKMGGIVPGYTAGRTRADRSEPVPWQPKVFVPEPPPKTKREMLREAAAQRSGVADRFSGIDFTAQDDFDD